MSLFSMLDSYVSGEAQKAAAAAAREQQAVEQMVSPVNAEIALKSLMDAELALTKARDLLRQSRAIMTTYGWTHADAALLAAINDLLGS